VKTFRQIIQSLILGAYLGIHKEISPGLVVAGSILLGRAFGPLDLMIASWRNFLQARESYFRLAKLLEQFPALK
jgi:ATP-binding cassette, subfamily C, bacterial EexD